jgi:hypothetical protein
LYILTGADDCEQYYYYGRDGQIPPHLCESLQYFAFKSCGCEKISGEAPEQNDGEISNQAPEQNGGDEGDSGGSDGNERSDGNEGSDGDEGEIKSRKEPLNWGKDGAKIGNQDGRGGHGNRGGRVRVRTLKGTK